MRRMYVRQRRVPRGATLLVGVGAAVAGVMYFGADGSQAPRTAAAEIAGAPLDSPAEIVPVVTTAPAKAAVRAVASLALGDLDLAARRREGDRYVLPLPDGRLAELTLDPDLQEAAEKLLDQSRAPRGAIVAMAPDGTVLALAGRRTEEPTGSRTGTFDAKLALDPWAPAASIFKLVTASALVQAGVDPGDKVCYHGGVRSVVERNLRDDPRDSRCEDLTYGVAHSNNAILGKLAFQKLQPKSLTAVAEKLGWGVAGVTKSLIGELTAPAEHDLAFAKMAAGFSDARLSVMGGALLAATFADGGEQPAPRLIAAIDGTPVPVGDGRRVMSTAAAKAVARMMMATCDSGSAAKSFGRGSSKVRVAGKTGTLARSEPFYMEHSWFVGFAPADKPQLIVSVVLGNAESWHLRGHEAARRLIDRFLRAIDSEKDRSTRRAKS